MLTSIIFLWIKTLFCLVYREIYEDLFPEIAEAQTHAFFFLLPWLSATSAVLIVELSDYVIIAWSDWTTSKLLSDHQNV